MYVTTGM